MEGPVFVRPHRVHQLNEAPLRNDGHYVLYVMEASQRSIHNYALEVAVWWANQLRKPLLVFCGVSGLFEFPNSRRLRFMLEGLVDVNENLKQRGIRLLVSKASPYEGAKGLSQQAALVVLDRGYLKRQRKWRNQFSQEADVTVVEVEGDVVCPVETVSQRAEPYARTFRPKVMLGLDYFLEKLPGQDLEVWSLEVEAGGFEELSISEELERLNEGVAKTNAFPKGGEIEALERLSRFVSERLPLYAELASDPGVEATSGLSPYLRFGQISPVQILQRIFDEYPQEDPNVAAFVNELVVWRELARNRAWYAHDYDSYDGLPGWARATLEEHAGDPRDYLYPLEMLESAQTHDSYWNAAQKELLSKGAIHNYVRMYWGKKILEWTEHPRLGFEVALYLNDKYALDGEDPNGYAGVSWVFGAFDRPFPERNIYGKVRKMGYGSLRRKLHIDKYLQRWG
ncbi:deoxyribodipyrimidine photolyase [Coprothermobacteraceae bacterium]|nr:deoxyribodipyrimidine photolyase [Coprothermobacteraceae bacterium]